jgi:hypothetical protein
MSISVPRSRLVALAAALLPAVAAAQPATEPTPHYVDLNEVLHAGVDLAPAAREPVGDVESDRREVEKGEDKDPRRDPAREESDAQRRPSRAAGEVVDLMYLEAGGKFVAVVIRLHGGEFAAGKTVVVPPSHLRTTGARLALTTPRAQLVALDGFDLASARSAGLENRIGAIHDMWRTAGLGEDGEVITTEPPAAAATAVEVGVASELQEHRVWALEEPFGTVARVVLDWNAQRVAFCLVEHDKSAGGGSRHYLLPYEGLTWQPRGASARLVVGQPTARLETAEIEQTPGSRQLVDPKVAARALALFHLDGR